MAPVAIALTVASAAMQAKNTAAAGKASQQAALDHQAAQARQAAGQERAGAQRSAFDQRRQARLAESRALALGAASGAGTADPTFVNLFGDLGAEGEYRSLTALHGGEERARNLEMQADLRQFEGAQAAIAGGIEKRLARSKASAQLVGGLADAFTMGAKYY
jgi:hypothetical protein